MKRFSLLCLLLFLLAMGLWGCGQDSEAQDPPTMEVSDAAVAVDAKPVQEETESSEDLDPEEDPAAQPVEVVDNCIDCHSDQEMLTDTAAPEEEVESESEGEG